MLADWIKVRQNINKRPKWSQCL